MISRLLGKEMKLTLVSLTYWLIVAVISLFIFTQIGTEITVIQKPKPTDESFGMTQTKDKQLIQKQTYGTLYLEFHSDSYGTYPLGFHKGVTLDEDEQQEVQKILEQASGLTMTELEQEYEAQVKEKMEDYFDNNLYVFPLRADASYEQFERDMLRVTDIVGAGSSYEKDEYLSAAVEPKTYKQALKEYQLIVEKDRVTGAYARMVCDYLGIILGIIPVFLGATVVLRDKRGQAEQVIYSRAISSIRLVGSRYVETVLLLLLPVVLISLMPAVQVLAIADKLDVSGDLLLFFQYILGWLLPTILFVVGLSFFITELFGGIAAIVVQVIFWLVSIFSNSTTIVGGIGLNLIPRFNKVGERAIFEHIFDELVWNRVFFAGVGLLLFLLAVAIYDYKRNGGRLLGKSV
ncbi:hypothetical protein [Candidatus Enterococcus clewellii]|uniref:Uncharacterized protein n=1 Tax=Candidatus Enterococcus clewellii TaxID=1834193 RepID=A0A242JWV1_9ENTE|nr:hypothetical protein [Enterococcus sp. 9E7_DIV0242]OTP09795.1 hypothetical protein A5888_003991 [Enterococcus sp. 9E7_DIV0242]